VLQADGARIAPMLIRVGQHVSLGGVDLRISQAWQGRATGAAHSLGVILRPMGGGNWSPVELQVDGGRIPPELLKVDQQLTLGGMVFRISEVRA
jgi:hypothetical protein